MGVCGVGGWGAQAEAPPFPMPGFARWLGVIGAFFSLHDFPGVCPSPETGGVSEPQVPRAAWEGNDMS